MPETPWVDDEMARAVLMVYCSLQHVLTILQQRQLDELSDWLRRMEAFVDEYVTPEPLQKLLEKHKV